METILELLKDYSGDLLIIVAMLLTRGKKSVDPERRKSKLRALCAKDLEKLKNDTAELEALEKVGKDNGDSAR